MILASLSWRSQIYLLHSICIYGLCSPASYATTLPPEYSAEQLPIKTTQAQANNSLKSDDLTPAKALLETITITANRKALSLQKSPLDIATLSSQANEKQNIAHVQQIINNVPGVNFQRNSGIEYLPAIRSPVLTGSGACGSIAVLENAIAVRPASFCNVNGLMETHHQLAGSIEVLKGPGNSFYGSNAVFGAINIIDVATINDDNYADLTFGEHGFVRTNTKFSNDRFASALTLMHSDGVRDDSQQDQQKLSLRYQGDKQSFLQHSDLTLVNINQNTAGYISGYQAYKDSSISRSNPNPEAYRDVFALRMSQQYQSLNNTWLFRPYLRYNDMEFALHFLPGNPIEQNSHVSVGSQFQYTLDIDPVAEQQSLYLGIDFDVADIELSQYQPLPTQGSDFLKETIPEGQQYDFSVMTYNIASFAQYQQHLNERLSINLGVRVEYNVYDYQNQMNSGRVDDQGNACGFGGCRYNRPKDSVDHFLDTSLNFGATYQLFAQQQLFANASKGFRPPQISEMYRLQRQQSVSDLDSESIDAVELGWRGDSTVLSTLLNHQLSGPMAFTLSSYYYQKQDVIFRDSDFYQINGGKTDHLGVELGLKQTFSAEFSSDVSYSYAKHTYANNPDTNSNSPIKGNDIDTAPRHFGRLALHYAANDINTLTLAINHTSEYYLDIDNEFQYQGHTLADLYFNSDVTGQLKWHIKVLNIADVKYAERADYSTFSGYRYFPGQGRRVFLGASYQFN